MPKLHNIPNEFKSCKCTECAKLVNKSLKVSTKALQNIL